MTSQCWTSYVKQLMWQDANMMVYNESWQEVLK